MKTAIVLFFTVSCIAVSSFEASAQSLLGTTPVGSCPDATPEEAASMGFQQVPMKMPQFVQRSPITAEGFEARIAGHKSADFSKIDESFKSFSLEAPKMQNKLAPLPDAQLFLFPEEGVPTTQRDPLYAFCFSYDAADWSFMPGAEVDGIGKNAAVAGLAPLTIPAQTYAVFEYDGPRADVANFRYTLTSAFWPVSSVRRLESPNFEVYPNGDDGTADNVNMQMWVAVDPSTIPSSIKALNYGSAPQ